MPNTFTVASDSRLVDFIERARERLVIVAPALTAPVAAALANRLSDLGTLAITVVVDADPEAYRLGYGESRALELLQDASTRNLFDLRVQEGVRIGIVISDDAAIVFSPVPLLIEAGSTSVEKPNAILLTGGAADQLARATGAGAAEGSPVHEIGKLALTPQAIEQVKQDLNSNPAQPFDVARALRVFNSKVQYVEFEVENCRFNNRQVPLPPELLELADEGLKGKITSKLRVPMGDLGTIEMSIQTFNGAEKFKLDEKWIGTERKRIEDTYTYTIPRFGRVILSVDRSRFDQEVERFGLILTAYRNAIVAKLEGVTTDLKERLVTEFLPRWCRRPPPELARFQPSEQDLQEALRRVVGDSISEAISFEPPTVSVLYKNIAPESVGNIGFTEPLRKIMRKRHVPAAIIDSLFSSGDAAPGRDSGLINSA